MSAESGEEAPSRDIRKWIVQTIPTWHCLSLTRPSASPEGKIYHQSGLKALYPCSCAFPGNQLSKNKRKNYTIRGYTIISRCWSQIVSIPPTCRKRRAETRVVHTFPTHMVKHSLIRDLNYNTVNFDLFRYNTNSFRCLFDYSIQKQ